MTYSKDSGYGRQTLNSVSVPNISGKTFVVGKSGLANRAMVTQLFTNDNDGAVRYFATVDAAISACTAGAGDMVYVLPGHTETVTSTSIALDVAGVSVVCLSQGSLAPTFTYGAAAATITVSGANCSWKGGNFVANFDNVAAAFTIGAAVNFKLDGGVFTENSDALHFLSIVVTGATDNEADGLTVVNNYWLALALAPNAFISILAAEKRVLIADNFVDMAATNNVGHFITLAAKIVSGVRIMRNVCIVVGATNATVGIFLTGSGTTSTGLVSENWVSSLDTTTELVFTAGTGLKFFNNLYTGTADASGYLLPAADSAA